MRLFLFAEEAEAIESDIERLKEDMQNEISPKKKAVLAEKLARIVREKQQKLGLRHWSRCFCVNYRFTRYFWILPLQ